MGCDIHERGALTLSTGPARRRHGGHLHRPLPDAEGVASAAVSEDVDVIALSDHTGSLPIIAAAGRIDELEGLDAAERTHHRRRPADARRREGPRGHGCERELRPGHPHRGHHRSHQRTGVAVTASGNKRLAKISGMDCRTSGKVEV